MTLAPTPSPTPSSKGAAPLHIEPKPAPVADSAPKGASSERMQSTKVSTGKIAGQSVVVAGTSASLGRDGFGLSCFNNIDCLCGIFSTKCFMDGCLPNCGVSFRSRFSSESCSCDCLSLIRDTVCGLLFKLPAACCSSTGSCCSRAGALTRSSFMMQAGNCLSSTGSFWRIPADSVGPAPRRMV